MIMKNRKKIFFFDFSLLGQEWNWRGEVGKYVSFGGEIIINN